MFHDPVRHGEGWFRGAMGTGVSGVVMGRQREAKDVSESGADHPAGQDGGE